MARTIYHVTPERERDAKKRQLARILSVSERTIREWLSRIDKDSKEARNKRIFEMWLACWTIDEIAAEVGCSAQPVKDVVSDFSEGLPENLKPAASHLTDFDIPIYNVWKQQTKSAGSQHFGNSEATWVDNLLQMATGCSIIAPGVAVASQPSAVERCRCPTRRNL